MDNKQLIAALEMWAPMVASGYEVPAAGQVMMEAARRLKELSEPSEEEPIVYDDSQRTGAEWGKPWITEDEFD